MELETLDTVIVSDLHGHDGLFQEVIERYPGVRIISNGDSIDGPHTPQLLDLFGEHNILQTTGNHELVLRGSLLTTDQENRDAWQQLWRHNDSRYRQYEYGMLDSYGVPNVLQNEEAAHALQHSMEQLGHLGLLQTAQLYYETDEFIVLHAGLTYDSWQTQKHDLDMVQEEYSAGVYRQAPDQILDPDHRLANSDAHEATDKIVLSGHAHSLEYPKRVIDHGRRVRLASRLAIGEPLHVWQSWDKQIVTIHQ